MVAALILILAAAALAWRLHVVGRPRLAAIIAGTPAYFLSLIALGVEQYFAARVGRPFADGAMLRLDGALDVSWVGFYELVFAHPVASAALLWVYNKTFWGLWLVVLALGWCDRGRMWWVLGANVVAGIATMILFALWPTVGPEAILRLADHFPSVGLPRSVSLLLALRAGGPMPIPHDGLVFFPSYHAVGVALTIYGVLVLPKWLRWPLFAWAAVTAVSLGPIGGHYFTDVLTGLALPVAALALGHVAAFRWPFPQSRHHSPTLIPSH